MDFIKDTRGFRNNNPGNIRNTDINWKKEVKGDDQAFETFDSVEFGIRAIFVLLSTYKRKHGLTNIRDMIHRFAPTNENDTKRYILSVLHYMSEFTPKANKAVNSKGELCDPESMGVMGEFVAAIIHHENGFQPFNFEFIEHCSKL